MRVFVVMTSLILRLIHIQHYSITTLFTTDHPLTPPPTPTSQFKSSTHLQYPHTIIHIVIIIQHLQGLFSCRPLVLHHPPTLHYTTPSPYTTLPTHTLPPLLHYPPPPTHTHTLPPPRARCSTDVTITCLLCYISACSPV